jgi:hypothetical protein
MKTILVGLAALLIATQCLSGLPGVSVLPRLLRNLGITVEKGATKEEINRILWDRGARTKFLERVKKQDPKLFAKIWPDLLVAERASMKRRLKGFTPKNFEFRLKNALTALSPKTAHEREVVAWITNDLVDKAVDNLPRDFYDEPTRLPIESAMERAVADHQSGELSERITYDRASSQLDFKFDLAEVNLEKASSTNFGERVDRYLKGVERGEPDIDGLSAP